MFKRTFLSVILLVHCLTVSKIWGAGSSTDESLVEEGWRYQRDLKINIIPESAEVAGTDENFQMLHSAMAHTIEASMELSRDFFGSAKDKSKGGSKSKAEPGAVKEEEDKGDGEKVLSIFRFTPIIQVGRELKRGDTVTLPSALFEETPPFPLWPPLIPTSETVFVSGWCPFCDTEGGLKGAVGKFVTTRDAIFPRGTGTPGEGDKKAERMFSMLPSMHPDKPQVVGQVSKHAIAVRFVQRNYIDPWLFESSILFRYPMDATAPAVFRRGNYDPIRRIHARTLETIAERKRIVAKDFADLLVVTQESDVVESLKKFGDLKKGQRKFHDVAAANSYTCAEQTGLDYIADKRVIEYLQMALGVRESHFKGLIVHLHCTHTPCGTCITAFARESEPGGLFVRIAGGKPVKVIGSCTTHYARPGAMIPYKETTWLKSILDREDTNTFYLDPATIERNLPYPVVLLEYAGGANFQVNEREYSTLSRQEAEQGRRKESRATAAAAATESVV